MTTDEVFAAFGGKEAVQAVTRAKRNAVNNWRGAGIPYCHWPALIEEATRRGLNGITFDALESTRAKQSQAAA